MKNLIMIFIFCLSYSAMAQTNQDSVFINNQNEYLTIVVETAGSSCNIYISKDSISFDKKSFKNVEPFNLTVVTDILSNYSKDGWEVQNSNISMIGDSSPYRAYIYYFLSRKKDNKKVFLQ
ncbi:hypothetical protein LJC68_07240 [Bacteroidales bacterium OttesenSCG-928-B11]|nr:hypothetical protein [Bacteroidales bacterium OttesenSCG-928-C03]MDL2312653.1 hypothetical protein [Bacteroidales bacterium OttesenSCG-928-B11]MDL2326124.1 hypothetical protein [Bacteroidales bacterium OttesenSCG-928-A14]